MDQRFPHRHDFLDKFQTNSQCYPVTSGVAQYSVLGPSLILVCGWPPVIVAFPLLDLDRRREIAMYRPNFDGSFGMIQKSLSAGDKRRKYLAISPSAGESE